MSDINSAMLSGRLVRDPYTRKTTGGDLVLFTLAANTKYKDRAGETQSETAFVPCKAMGAWATSLEGAHKGDFVIVSGRLKTESWEKEGSTHYQLTFVCQTIHVVPRNPGNGAGPTTNGNQTHERLGHPPF